MTIRTNIRKREVSHRRRGSICGVRAEEGGTDSARRLLRNGESNARVGRCWRAWLFAGASRTRSCPNGPSELGGHGSPSRSRGLRWIFVHAMPPPAPGPVTVAITGIARSLICKVTLESARWLTSRSELSERLCPRRHSNRFAPVQDPCVVNSDAHENDGRNARTAKSPASLQTPPICRTTSTAVAPRRGCGAFVVTVRAGSRSPVRAPGSRGFHIPHRLGIARAR
jgi:hypothetical protein